MTNTIDGLSHLSDDELLAEVRVATGREREATARLIALLAQLDARRLYLGAGCSSLFTYCTQVLHLSEHAAYGRIEAARTARKFPVTLDLLADGSVTLTAVTLLAPHLTPANHCDVLNAARHKTKREVEHMVACLRPQPAVPATVRKLPAPKMPHDPVPPATTELLENNGAGSVVAPRLTPRPVTVTPLAPEHYKVQFTVSRETHDKLRRAQNLLRHAIPNGDPAAIVDRALTLLLADLERLRPERGAQSPRERERGWAASAKATASCGEASRRRGPASSEGSRPKPASHQGARGTASGSRHVPAAARREVWTRDGGQCAFVGTEGRCGERGFLEFHHVQPYAAGGRTVVENLQLRCRAHNVHEAEQYFGVRLPLLARERRSEYRSAPRSRPRMSVGQLRESDAPAGLCTEERMRQ